MKQYIILKEVQESVKYIIKNKQYLEDIDSYLLDTLVDIAMAYALDNYIKEDRNGQAD